MVDALMTIFLISKPRKRKPRTRAKSYFLLLVTALSIASILFAQEKPPPPSGPAAPPAGGAPAVTPGGAPPPGGMPGAEGAPAAAAGTPKFEPDPATGGKDQVAFTAIRKTGLTTESIVSADGKIEEIYEFAYYDPTPDYKRAVNVRIPKYFTQGKRTVAGWYARFRWWEQKPDWSEAERAAIMAGVVAGSRATAKADNTKYLPKWLTEQPPASPQESAAIAAALEAGSQYVGGR
ncbi:MAG: hypothetical protein AUJ92_02935 [Armatimonadetes bacterium CG2_30_59_28]|nr:MAG: hypothetical protein AUJ92_02935 [Armatimonadetes bacterium CG2_30_59_28]PIU64794.1 MAG: hypothetical protein COS85_11270 [Armatimonadetes bacterium CG07_land_8_20_14_0_80_59_28]PIY45530.1 MAG: hypothetical protein COZ05_06515 [Armatimonadetes bacterium CG_4_10_14_3_um_filter_59_10]PJB62286.1 MAG: hypothetical protein CO095_18780 [Armatimonadetes bacterium CG_4_9_14_3_um_filter_58_7]